MGSRLQGADVDLTDLMEDIRQQLDTKFRCMELEFHAKFDYERPQVKSKSSSILLKYYLLIYLLVYLLYATTTTTISTSTNNNNTENEK